MLVQNVTFGCGLLDVGLLSASRAAFYGRDSGLKRKGN